MSAKKILLGISNFYLFLGISALFISLVIFLVPTAPYIVYSLNPSETEKEIEKLSEEVVEEEILTDSRDKLPPIDLSLPEKSYIVIEKIGVYSPLSQDKNYIEVLRKGSWMVPEFGTPTNGKKPIIIASHRFGYSSWSTKQRNEISFYNLPKVNEGDTFEIIWEQRKFQYRIYKTEESNYITDYNADLILYTCKFFNSPLRIFKYAELIPID